MPDGHVENAGLLIDGDEESVAVEFDCYHDLQRFLRGLANEPSHQSLETIIELLAVPYSHLPPELRRRECWTLEGGRAGVDSLPEGQQDRQSRLVTDEFAPTMSTTTTVRLIKHKGNREWCTRVLSLARRFYRLLGVSTEPILWLLRRGGTTDSSECIDGQVPKKSALPDLNGGQVDLQSTALPV